MTRQYLDPMPNKPMKKLARFKLPGPKDDVHSLAFIDFFAALQEEHERLWPRAQTRDRITHSGARLRCSLGRWLSRLGEVVRVWF